MMRRLGAAAVLLVLPALLAPAGLPGAGRAQAEDARPQELQRTPTLRNEVYARLATAQQAATPPALRISSASRQTIPTASLQM